MRLELITWRDARGLGAGAWMDRSHFVECNQDPLFVRTVGWVLKEDRHAVWTCSNWAGNDDISDVTEIPKGMVKERVVLKGADE